MNEVFISNEVMISQRQGVGSRLVYILQNFSNVQPDSLEITHTLNMTRAEMANLILCEFKIKDLILASQTAQCSFKELASEQIIEEIKNQVDVESKTGFNQTTESLGCEEEGQSKIEKLAITNELIAENIDNKIDIHKMYLKENQSLGFTSKYIELSAQEFEQLIAVKEQMDEVVGESFTSENEPIALSGHKNEDTLLESGEQSTPEEVISKAPMKEKEERIIKITDLLACEAKNALIDIRKMYVKDDNSYGFTPKGISLTVKEFQKLIQASEQLKNLNK